MLFCMGLLILPVILALPSPVEEKYLEEYPYRVVLNVVKSKGNKGGCGGTLVTPSYVLAPAHCADDTPSIRITLGSSDFPENQIQLESKEHIIHPGYDPKRQLNDIALIELPQAVKLNDHIKTIKLASGNETFAGRDAVLVTAENVFGKPKPFPTQVLSNEACEKVQTLGSYVTPTHLCAKEITDTKSCHYAGSPLVIDGVQVGLASFGVSPCQEHIPSVFTRLSSYSDWINKIRGQE